MRCALSFAELLRLVEFNLFIISIIQQTPWFEPRRSNVKKCWTLKDEIHSLTSVKFYRCLYNLDLYTVPCKNGICTPWAFCVWPTQNSVKLVTNDNIHPSIHCLQLLIWAGLQWGWRLSPAVIGGGRVDRTHQSITETHRENSHTQTYMPTRLRAVYRNWPQSL